MKIVNCARDLKVSETGNSKRSCNILIIGVVHSEVQLPDDVSVHFFGSAVDQLIQKKTCSTSIYHIRDVL